MWRIFGFSLSEYPEVAACLAGAIVRGCRAGKHGHLVLVSKQLPAEFLRLCFLSPFQLSRLTGMFPEFRGLITKLKTEDSHFARLFDKHNELDHKIKAMEAGVERTASVEIENLKKEKLRLKDEMYEILRKADGKA